MKRISAFILIFWSLIIGCSTQSSKQVLPGGETEYHFFKTLSQKIPILNPDHPALVAKSSSFDLRITDIFPAIYQEYGFFGDPPEKLKKGEIVSLLKSQIDQLSTRLLLATAAQERGYVVPSDSVKKQVTTLFAHFGGREMALRDLAKQGMTLDMYKKEFRDKQLYQQYMKNYVQKIVYSKLRVSEKELKDFYSRWATSDFQLLTLSFAGKTHAQKDSLRQKIENIAQKARNGSDFSTLVKTYSDLDYKKNVGGLFTDFSRMNLPLDIAQAIDKTPEGAVCDPFERDNEEFMVIKVLKKKKFTQPYEKVKPQIEHYLLWAKKRATFQAMVDSLKKQYHYEQLVQF